MIDRVIYVLEGVFWLVMALLVVILVAGLAGKAQAHSESLPSEIGKCYTDCAGFVNNPCQNECIARVIAGKHPHCPSYCMNGPSLSQSEEGETMKLKNIRRNIGDFILQLEDAVQDAEKASQSIQAIIDNPNVDAKAKEAAASSLALIESLRQALEDLR